MSRLSETLANIPLATLSIIALCTLTFTYQLLFDPPLHQFTMCPRNVLYLSEYYRIITSNLFHGGFLHFFMNMSSTAAISSSLEHRCGTFKQLIIIVWGMILTSIIYMMTSWILYMVFDYQKLMLQHSVGFSCVIFQLSVLESNINPDRTRSVFGFIKVPSYLYPWALLVVLQVLIPAISFLGHLSGILVGTLQLFGILDVFLLPSDDYLRKMEEWPLIANFINSSSSSPYRGQFVRTPPEPSSESEMSSSSGRNPSMLLGAIKRGFGIIWKFIRDILETIKVAIFGRGSIANSNIELGSVEALWSNAGRSSDNNDEEIGTGVGDGGGVDDDDDWVGLPPMPESSSSSKRGADSRMI